MSDVFHRAAKDGYVDLLKEATRRDCNKQDEDGMTPTLWAAYYGNLEALRMIVGRGGNPDKCDYLGNTCLHHAATNGFMHCVTFLVSFGSNLWSLDNHFHTALDVAALTNRHEIVRYLDNVYSKQQTANKKLVKKMREKAMIEAQQRVKKYNKLQEKAQKKAEKVDKKMQQEFNGSVRSYSAGTLSKSEPKYSSLTVPRGGTKSEVKPYSHHFATINTHSRKTMTGGVARMIKKKKDTTADTSQDFKIGEHDMDGTKTIKSLSGLRRDNHVMYVRPSTNGTNGKGSLSSDSSTSSNFTTHTSPLSRTISEPDFYFPGDSGIESSSSPDPEPSIFERPGFGNVAFINKNITSSALLSLANNTDDEVVFDPSKPHPPPLATSSANSILEPSKRHSVHEIMMTPTRKPSAEDTASIGTVGTLARRIRALPWDNNDLQISDDEDEVVQNPNDASLELFLAANGLSDFLSVFHRERIDLLAVMLLSDYDMIELGLPMGPRRKLSRAIDRRKEALDKPGVVFDSML